jgi:hypothetical protein
MEIRLFGITTNIWKISLGFSYITTVIAFLDGALGISTNVHLLSNENFPFTLGACFILHNTYHFVITKSKKPFLHVFSMGNEVLSLHLIFGILLMSEMNSITWVKRLFQLDVDYQLKSIIALSGPIFLIGFVFFAIPILIAVMYYFKTKTWMKKYTFYKHGLGTLDDLMTNNEFIFHVNLLTAAQVYELLVESFNLKANTTGLHGLITIESDLDSWEYSALYYISEKRPEILKKICDLNSHIHRNMIFTSNYNKPFKRTKYYRQVLKPFILENY